LVDRVLRVAHKSRSTERKTSVGELSEAQPGGWKDEEALEQPTKLRKQSTRGSLVDRVLSVARNR